MLTTTRISLAQFFFLVDSTPHTHTKKRLVHKFIVSLVSKLFLILPHLSVKLFEYRRTVSISLIIALCGTHSPNLRQDRIKTHRHLKDFGVPIKLRVKYTSMDSQWFLEKRHQPITYILRYIDINIEGTEGNTTVERGWPSFPTLNSTNTLRTQPETTNRSWAATFKTSHDQILTEVVVPLTNQDQINIWPE